jgi:enoyl-CoA hydratase
MTFVDLTLEDAIATIAVTRPDKLNALNREIGERLLGALAAARSARALIVTGTSAVFSAGADLAEPVDDPRDLDLWSEVNWRLAESPAPSIAAIEGHCLGAGLALAVCCDLRVAANSAELGMPEVRRGVVAATGGTQRLPRLIGPARAKQLLLVGDPIDAVAAERCGLVNWVVPDGTALAHARRIADRIVGASPFAVHETKRLVDDGVDLNLTAALACERASAGRVIASPDAEEGARAFAERRSPRFADR